jgi:hypothetical protein
LGACSRLRRNHRVLCFNIFALRSKKDFRVAPWRIFTSKHLAFSEWSRPLFKYQVVRNFWGEGRINPFYAIDPELFDFHQIWGRPK